MSLESSYHGDILGGIGRDGGVPTQLHHRSAMMLRAGPFLKVFVLIHSFLFPACPQTLFLLLFVLFSFP